MKNTKYPTPCCNENCTIVDGVCIETQTERLYKELNKAKDAVKWLLEHADGLVDMHGIEYWAGVIESKRQEIRDNL